MLRVGQKITIYTNDRKELSPRTISKSFKNGRIEIRGKTGSWYEEEPGLYRNWNNPGYVTMVAVVED